MPPKQKITLKTLSFFLLTILGVIYSCHKDDKSQATAVTDPAVAQAKTWYEANYPMTASSKSSLATQSIPAAVKATGDLSQLIKPDWLNAAKYNRLGKSVIEMPVDPSVNFGSDLKNVAGNKVYSNKKYNRSYYLLLNDGKTYQAFIMMIMADSAYVNNDLTKLTHNTYRTHDADFSGLVLYLTPTGQYAGGYAYQNGKLVQPAGAVAVSKNQSLTTTRLQPDENAVCLDWFLNTYDDDELVSSEYLYTTCTGGESGGSGSGTATAAPPPCPTNTGGGSPPVPQQVDPVPTPIGPGDGGYPPPPTTTNGCTVSNTGTTTPDYGEDDPAVCLNCRIAQNNFGDFLNAVQNDGYNVGQSVISYAIGPDGTQYSGTLTPIYNSQGTLVATYFTPASTAGPFEAGTQYNLGTGTAGTSPGTGNNIVIFGNSSGVVGPGITYPSIGGGGGSGTTFANAFSLTNLFNQKNGNKPLAEYADPCNGSQGIWNTSISTSPSQEVFGAITADGKFITIAIVGFSGGSIGGLYNYNNGTTVTAYYTYPDTQGAPIQTYAGMIHAAGQYFIPIVATVHTHNPCLVDGTDGITNQTLSNGDQNLASSFNNIKHYIIGCNAVGSFSSASTDPTVLATGALSTTCSVIK